MRKNKYSSNSGVIPFASAVSTRGSRGFRNVQNVRAETKIAIANPEIIALMKNKTGNHGVYHSGSNLFGTIRNSDPSDD